MRVLLDADTPVQMLGVLRHVLNSHTVDHVHEVGRSPKKDRDLLRDAARRGYQVFVTNDANQLNDPQETDAIRKSRLHHVRYSQRERGLAGLGLAVGAVVAAMPGVLSALEDVIEQRLVHVSGLDPNKRFTVTDPQRDPPRYWQ